MESRANLHEPGGDDHIGPNVILSDITRRHAAPSRAAKWNTATLSENPNLNLSSSHQSVSCKTELKGGVRKMTASLLDRFQCSAASLQCVPRQSDQVIYRRESLGSFGVPIG